MQKIRVNKQNCSEISHRVILSDDQFFKLKIFSGIEACKILHNFNLDIYLESHSGKQTIVIQKVLYGNKTKWQFLNLRILNLAFLDSVYHDSYYASPYVKWINSTQTINKLYKETTILMLWILWSIVSKNLIQVTCLHYLQHIKAILYLSLPIVGNSEYIPVEYRTHFMTVSDDDVTLQGKDPGKNKDGEKNISQVVFEKYRDDLSSRQSKPYKSSNYAGRVFGTFFW